MGSKQPLIPDLSLIFAQLRIQNTCLFILEWISAIPYHVDQNHFKMFIKIPESLFQDFEGVSGRNFSSLDNKHNETLAIITGEESLEDIVATGLIYPDQDCHPFHVTSKGSYEF